jgi:tRNA modification GTPase
MNGRTVFAVLTPAGSAAIATLALDGPQAWDIVRRLVRSGAQLPHNPATDQFWHRRFGGPPGDEVVIAAIRSAPGPRVEIHCHGGPEVVRMIGEELTAAGATSIASEALSDDLPPWTSVARHELSRAPTLRTAAILLDQANGAVDRALISIGETLNAAELDRTGELVAGLFRYARTGLHLTRPWRVTVGGAPNVGKSSLVNALAGYERSVVTPMPGTTRDVVVTSTAIDGWPVDLVDTAGDRPADDALEREGIARGRSAAAEADLRLWVLDASKPPIWPDPAGGSLIVVNKSDLPPAWDTKAVAGAVVVSALTGTGMSQLCREIGRRLVSDPPLPGAAVPFSPGLVDALERVRRAAVAKDVAATRSALAAVTSPPPARPE